MLERRKQNICAKETPKKNSRFHPSFAKKPSTSGNTKVKRALEPNTTT
jgi:hypothetical protein